MTLDADASADLLASLIRAREPFTFARIGDGDLYAACEIPPYGTGALANTNGEVATPKLCHWVRRALLLLGSAPGRVLVGDYLSRSAGDEGLRPEWRVTSRMFHDREMLHVEAIHLHRVSDALRGFYEAVHADRRRTVYVAPEALIPAVALLGPCDVCVVPPSTAHERINEAAAYVQRGGYDVVFVSAGLASKPIIAAAYDPAVTFVDLGSALDPLFVGETRTGQISRDDARALLEGLL